MATFLMIHGAWHGGWSFEPLRAALEASGHRMIAPDLPGIGGDEDALQAVTLNGWAAFVADLAEAQAEPVILCGHSRGGIVISQAAERAPGAIAALVYISAFLVPDGKSLNDMVSDEPRIPEFANGLSPTTKGAALALTPEGAVAAFYHLTPEPARSDAASRITPEPLAPLGTALSLSEAGFGSIPRHYIECSQDRAIPLSQQRAMQADLPVVSVATLESDHSPFLTCPDLLVKQLLRIAETAGR